MLPYVDAHYIVFVLSKLRVPHWYLAQRLVPEGFSFSPVVLGWFLTWTGGKKMLSGAFGFQYNRTRPVLNL